MRAGQVMTTEQSVGEAFWFHTLDLMRSRTLKWKHLREEFGEELWPDGLRDYSHSWDSKRGQKMKSWGEGKLWERKGSLNIVYRLEKSRERATKREKEQVVRKDSQLSWTEGRA